MSGPRGWSWCPGARGDCSICLAWVVGLWKFWVSDSTSVRAVCGNCAEAL